MFWYVARLYASDLGDVDVHSITEFLVASSIELAATIINSNASSHFKNHIVI